MSLKKIKLMHKRYRKRLFNMMKRSRLDMFRSRLVACEKIRVTKLHPGMSLKDLECFQKTKTGRHKYPSKWLYLKRYSPPLPRMIRSDLIKPCVMTQPLPCSNHHEKSTS